MTEACVDVVLIYSGFTLSRAIAIAALLKFRHVRASGCAYLGLQVIFFLSSLLFVLFRADDPAHL